MTPLRLLKNQNRIEVESEQYLMAELTTVYKCAIPEFVAFPIKKSTLEEYLSLTPQQTIDVSFMSWFSDTGFDHRVDKGHRRKLGLSQPGDTRVLRAYFGGKGWGIWVHPVPKAELHSIKAHLVPSGLVRLRNWLLKHAAYDGSNGQRPGSFEIDFDGRGLIFRE
jgi:hypothetical protein